MYRPPRAGHTTRWYTGIMKQFMAYLPWLGAAAILVVIFGTMYGVVQQATRQGANSPQIQIAEDVGSALSQGAKPETFTSGRVDMAASLAPFVIIYDQNGKVVSGSGYLGEQVPVAPVGVLRAANGQEYHAVTWEPEPNVRVAAVTVAAGKYYVLSGRSLREVEKNEDMTFWRVFAGGAASWLVLGGVFALTQLPMTKRSR